MNQSNAAAYVEQAANLLVQEQGVSFSSEDSFTEWANRNMRAIISRARAVQAETCNKEFNQQEAGQ